ncbi:integrase arm-type DNA-binding domain-containing protein [Bradyrhizobium sp. AUGA SZCCT0222]|uniref:tyrosine-type recombinase/integrase n=1 Tax=Bradyrhizobium sp. AUGA SZCCT0222 TaxID=2807668 RepID=UPI001BA48C07|nr:site-specific integrase [Bradyrhizobium sp. AUGA SZCCT0222]MBR1270448.1 integrase arm-type DNA-binding domain-containing protein [Bradyrhizobium sp. AUGA SZCCT0222]
MQVKLTAGYVATASGPSDGKDRIIYWDEKRPGFGLMVTAKGKRSFVFQYRNGHGDSRRASLSGTTRLPDAYKWADILQGDVAKGVDPVAKRKADRTAQSKKGKFRTIAEDYVKREAPKLRSMDQRIAILNRLIYPIIGDKIAAKLKRSDIVALLDGVEDNHGPAMADGALLVVRRICNWHATRDDDFRSPIVRGMGRSNATGRERILSDDEVRAVWAATGEIIANAEAERMGLFMYAQLLRYLLLTAVRLNEGARMDRSERRGGDWLISAARMKNKRDFLIPLSTAAISLLEAVPVIGEQSFGPIFTTNGTKPIAAFNQFKKAFDKRCGVIGWTNHDLRRTARSLMSRAGVDPDHAERALSHTIGGIRRTYDRHEFYNEKKYAFEALARQIELIVNPQPNIVLFNHGLG